MNDTINFLETVFYHVPSDSLWLGVYAKGSHHQYVYREQPRYKSAYLPNRELLRLGLLDAGVGSPMAFCGAHILQLELNLDHPICEPTLEFTLKTKADSRLYDLLSDAFNHYEKLNVKLEVA
jgi:hypothetical protein